jgi:hypothetical protein
MLMVVAVDVLVLSALERPMHDGRRRSRILQMRKGGTESLRQQLQDKHGLGKNRVLGTLHFMHIMEMMERCRP